MQEQVQTEIQNFFSEENKDYLQEHVVTGQEEMALNWEKTDLDCLLEKKYQL